MSDLPIISKELFVKSIESLRLQIGEDKKNAEIVAEIFGASTFYLYDNEKLIHSIIDLLSIWFDKEDLNHFCFQLNFGKISDEEEFESIEDFYDRLTKNI